MCAIDVVAAMRAEAVPSATAVRHAKAETVETSLIKPSIDRANRKACVFRGTGLNRAERDGAHLLSSRERA